MKGDWYCPIDLNTPVKSNKDRRERCKYCLDGALQTVCLTHPNASEDSFEYNSYDKAYWIMQEKLAKIIKPDHDNFDMDSEQVITNFNDKKSTTHEKVMGVLKKCINSLTKETK